MELKRYWRLLRRWIWLIVLVSAIAGTGSYFLKPRRYQATALIAVGDYMQSSSPDRNDILTGIQLAETYAAVAKTHDIYQTAAQAVGLPASGPSGIIQTRVLDNTSILEISATHENPVLAADLANEIARQLMGRSRFLEIMEWASTPRSPLSPNPQEMAVFGALVGH